MWPAAHADSHGRRGATALHMFNNKNEIAMTEEMFRTREQHRRALFADTWRTVVPEVFKDVPRYYRAGNVVASMGLWEVWVWQFIDTIRIAPGSRVLDVCAGTNDIGIRLLRRQPDLAVTAIDRSREMQAEGRRRAEAEGLRIESVIDDVHTLPFPDASFDAVTLQAASRHLQLDRVFPEILRVLKPGGSFHHCDMLKPDSALIEQLYLMFLHASVGVTATLFGTGASSREGREYFKQAIAHFYTAEELSAVLRLVGFDDVRCRTSLWGGMVAFHGARRPA
jgi:demethylmenaquinone methyltransferase/2-methoxy-6-polyprenyl-1,4-benzoquinol methylase